jgi:OOP family OmpA-OmpF porin
MKKLLAVIALSLTSTYSPISPAQGFVELGIGQAKVDLDAADFGADTVDNKDTTWAVSGGWMFHPNVGAEIGYRDLGETSASAVVPPNVLSATAEVDGFMLGAVGRIPVGPVEIAPRIGLYRWDVKGRVFLNGAQVDSADDDGTDLYFGVGVQYVIAKQFHVGAHWARFDIDGDDVDVIELKVGFRF